MAVRTIRGALVTLAVGIIIGIGATIWLGRTSGPAPSHAPSPAILAAQPTAQRSPAAAVVAADGAIAPAPAPLTVLPDFATLAERLSPVVVNISTSSQGKQQMDAPQFHGPGGGGQGGPQWPFGDGDPREFGEPFEHFFGPSPRQPQRPQRQRSLGSGFIIDTEGYILTNNHVVDNADEILVRLGTGKEYKASVVGKDAKTDIALLRIENAAGLTAVTLGDSDGLKVGEWVMAIGNPFGLDHTVTAGIVSAKGRFIGAGNYDDYIQTDAAINPGNSGGPLINLRGEVVGINSAIFSRTGGNIGIGFAVPINIAKELVPQLKEKGKVTRGWLGVLIQKVTPEIAESLGLKRPTGALVASVTAASPAARAGLKTGDLIVSIDGQAIDDPNAFDYRFATKPLGGSARVGIVRAGREAMLTVPLQTAPETPREEVSIRTRSPFMGLKVVNMSPSLADELRVDPALGGVVVVDVAGGSPAETYGFRHGDLIVSVNNERIERTHDLERAARGGSRLWRVTILRGGQQISAVFSG